MFATNYIQAQNLVPNPSFEQYNTCPNTGDQVQYCDGWTKYCASIFTPDYFNDCASSSTMGIPQNILLYQPDNRNCGAYMGLITWEAGFTDARETVGIQLSSPMVIGQQYYLSFNTVRGGWNNDGDNPSNNIGMRLSTVPYSMSNPVPIDNFSHLRSVSIISDTSNWVRISGSIIADSAYSYLALGNFYDDTNTDTLTLTCGSCGNTDSYYLIDDVCVSTDSILCNGGIDLLPCNVSIKENGFENEINIYPNPAENLITITKEQDVNDLNITIYNSLGQILFDEENINSYNKQIDISNYSNGLLFIKIESNNQQYTYKLLKQ